MSAFEELGVAPSIIRSLSHMQWDLPTPVQAESIPLILGGGDVAVAAETGSGKTGAFCIPIVQVVHEVLTGAAAGQIGLSDDITEEDDYENPMGLATATGGRSRKMAVVGNVAQARSLSAWHGVRGTRGVAKGRWAWSAILEDEGIGRVGFSKKGASLLLGTDGNGFGYGSTGMKSNQARFQEYGGKYGQGDIVTCLIDFESKKNKVLISCLKNGEDLGIAFETKNDGRAFYPALALKNAQMRVEFSDIDKDAHKLGYVSFEKASENDKVPAGSAEIFDKDGDTKMMDSNGKADASKERRKPLALILEPSRELASQVYTEIGRILTHVDDDDEDVDVDPETKKANEISTLLLIGGGSPKEEKTALDAGVDIICGTLGTIEAHLKRKTLDLSAVRFFVLDEADTFATDNLKTVLSFHGRMTEEVSIQTLLFSATLHSPEIKALSENIQRYPTWIDLKGKEAVPDSVHHALVRVDPDADTKLVEEVRNEITNKREKLADFYFPLDEVHNDSENRPSKKAKKSARVKESFDAADQRSETVKKLKLCALKKIVDANRMSHAMIFCRTQQDCNNVETYLLFCSGIPLEQHGQYRFRGVQDSGPQTEYSCAVLHGGRSQRERENAMQAFRLNTTRFLICTDVAARGIDISGLPYLVNLTLPDRSESYIHRVGRVGRAEIPGLAISIVATCKEAVWYHSCGKAKNGICQRRKLVDEGGCVMWYNEEKLLKEIEGRLKGKIECIENGWRRRGEGKKVAYGMKKEMVGLGEVTKKHLDERRDVVEDLMSMEDEVQVSFLQMKRKSLR